MLKRWKLIRVFAVDVRARQQRSHALNVFGARRRRGRVLRGFVGKRATLARRRRGDARARGRAVNDRARAPRERSGEHGCLQTRASSVESPCEVCDYECYLFWCLSLRLRLRCLCLFIAFFRFRFTLAMSKNPPISRSASRSSARRRPSSAPTVIPVVACFP